MPRLHSVVRPAAFLGLLVLSAVNSRSADIGGKITTTLNITEDSQLVDDVTCAVTGAPCIAITAPHVTLELNGFTMTGQADAQTGCSGGPTAFAPGSTEDGVYLNAQSDVEIHGPGLIHRFKGAGVFLVNSKGVTVTGVNISTTCLSGILVGGGSGHTIAGNVAVRNGNTNFPCGGI